jgi:glucokinase
MILAGDIGGTKTYLGRFAVDAGRPVPVEIKSFQTRSYTGLEHMVQEFLGRRCDVEVAAFGIPGPVVNERVDVTNVPWSLEASSLARSLKLRTVHLLNDLVATGYGIQALTGDELFVLNKGISTEQQTEALIAAGTGLGECVLQWHGCERTVLPCEAGHAGFAPHDSLQAELLQYLMRSSMYVCQERVLSGPGLVSIYNFLRDTRRGSENKVVAEAMREGDPAAVIAVHSEAGDDELSCRAMEVFLTAYGSEAGNLAVRTMALGGIYVGGGIAPKIARLLARGEFMRAFVEKERMEGMMPRIPVRVIMDDRTALRGAASFAFQATWGRTHPAP